MDVSWSQGELPLIWTLQQRTGYYRGNYPNNGYFDSSIREISLG